MTTAERLTMTSENVPKVFEAGKKAEYDAFWDAFQLNGTRTRYDYGFYTEAWSDEIFFPKYDINVVIPTGVHSYTFANNNITDLAGRLKECGVKLNTSDNARFSYMFYSARLLTHIPEIDMRKATYVVSMFQTANALHTIDKLIFADDGIEVDMTFLNCYALENIVIEGKIAAKFDIHWSSRLSRASIESVVTALSSETSGLSLILSGDAVASAFETSAGAKDGITSADWTALVATKNNWTISLS